MIQKSITTKIILDKRRLRNKDNKYPLKLRIIHNRKPYELRLKFYFTELEFNSVMDINSRKKNKDHRNIINEILQEVDRIIDASPFFDINNFKQQLFSDTKPISTIYYVFDMKSQEMKENDYFNSSNLYITVKNSLKNFSHSENLEFTQVDTEFLKKYVKWLQKREVSYSTINNYLRYIRAIFNYADAKNIYNKTKDTYPFGKYKIEIGASSHKNIALNSKQLKEFIAIETIPLTTKDLAKDLWLFSMHNGGINYIDIAHLTAGNIQNNILTFTRSKTKKTAFITGLKINIPLNQLSLDIIKKWKPENSNLLLPILNGLDDLSDIRKVKTLMKSRLRTFNKYTKDMGEEIGIEFPLTTYVARHTFASLMLKEGKSVTEIAEFTGHTDYKSLKHYLSGFDDKKKREMLSDVFGAY